MIVPFSEYEVVVTTGSERRAGSSANVFITLHGRKGVSPKLPLARKSEDTFDKGKKDQFLVICKDIGPLSYIR